MNGYVIGGYLVVLLSLSTYAFFLVQRLRAAKRRIGGSVRDVEERARDDQGVAR
jgi:hypothetical protein